MNEHIAKKKVFIFDFDSMFMDYERMLEYIDLQIINLEGKKPRDNFNDEKAQIFEMAKTVNPYKLYDKYLIESYGLNSTLENISNIRISLMLDVFSNIEYNQNVINIMQCLKEKKKQLLLLVVSPLKVYKFCNKNFDLNSIFEKNIITYDFVEQSSPLSIAYNKALEMFSNLKKEDFVLISNSDIKTSIANSLKIDVINSNEL